MSSIMNIHKLNKLRPAQCEALNSIQNLAKLRSSASKKSLIYLTSAKRYKRSFTANSWDGPQLTEQLHKQFLPLVGRNHLCRPRRLFLAEFSGILANSSQFSAQSSREGKRTKSFSNTTTRSNLHFQWSIQRKVTLFYTSGQASLSLLLRSYVITNSQEFQPFQSRERKRTKSFSNTTRR